MFKGRLGLETARIPHADRHGLLWLARGKLYVQDGNLRFATAGFADQQAGDYALPFQTITNVMLGPGTTVSHDALRLLSRHGTGLLAVGDDGVRFYACMPFGPDDSRLARKQVKAWSDATGARIAIARRMYAWRLGEVLPSAEITVLRGMEGIRARRMYTNLAQQFGIDWKGRRYNRQHPERTDIPNLAINHASSAVEGAALIAVAATGAVPQLGFIHEDSGHSFALDIADLFRDEITLPVAFEVAQKISFGARDQLEGKVRRLAGKTLKKKKIVSRMIGHIKQLFEDEEPAK